MTKMARVLITGAAGRIGAAARNSLADSRALLRLLDLSAPPDLRMNEEAVVADITDLEAFVRACEGIDCLVHLAGIPTEAEWDRLLPANVIGAYNCFEAARRAGVRRVVFASSNHATGYYPVDELLTPLSLPRPDSLYGAAKVWGEALASLYADRHGIQTCALRIGSFREKPLSKRELRTWISHRDMGQLLSRCVDAPDFHHFVAYGASGNADPLWSNGDLEHWLGYVPQDNGAEWVGEVPKDPVESAEAGRYHGGFYCEPDFKGAPRLT
jgi:uronate dehydrogenase